MKILDSKEDVKGRLISVNPWCMTDIDNTGHKIR